MTKIRKPIRVLAALIFVISAASSGVAFVQIYQSNNFSKTIRMEEIKLANLAAAKKLEIKVPVIASSTTPGKENTSTSSKINVPTSGKTSLTTAPGKTSLTTAPGKTSLTTAPGKTSVATPQKPLKALPISDPRIQQVVPTVKIGDVIGIIRIPKLSETYPIIQGTGESELKRGVGHFVNSAMPGEKENSVLSGHRDTVFTKIGKLVKGDLISVQTSDGIFKYLVVGHKIVAPNDKTVIAHTPTATLTLTSCYPFSYIGPAPKRYIVTAQLIN